MAEPKLVFCKRCGSMTLEACAKSDHCPVCHHVWGIFEYDAITWFKLPKEERDKYIEEHIIHDDETEYFKSLKQKDDANEKKSWDEAEKRVAQKTATNIPHCPICGSADLKKLSAVGKAVKIGFFGIFGAGDIGKTYKCNNCGSKF